MIVELLGQVRQMIEEELEGIDGGSLEDGPLQDHVSHWVEALDRWVKRVDLGLGRKEIEARAADAKGHGDGDSLSHTDGGADLPRDVQG
jgi:hypothetical protein